MNKVTLHFSRS